MKSVFALIAAVAVLASAQTSFANNACKNGDKSGRGNPTAFFPKGKATNTPVKEIRSTR